MEFFAVRDNMTSLNPIQPDPSVRQNENPSTVVGRATGEVFSRLIDDLFESRHPKSRKDVIAAEQAKADYLRKLALITSMVEQAQNSWKSAAGGPDGVSAQRESQYLFLKSKLQQISNPGGNSQVV
jgi:hypothetical protein